MSVFQTVAVTAFGVLLVFTLLIISRRRIGMRAGFGWSVLWIAGSLVVMFPEVTRTVAEVAGIQRGVDVVIYTALGVGLGSFFAVYMKFRRMERQITVLTRELAILQSALERGKNSSRGDQ